MNNVTKLLFFKVTLIDVMKFDDRPMHKDTLKKCIKEIKNVN